MGDFQGPFTVPPPPSPTSSDKSSIPMLYYGLVVVGIAAIALALYNFIIIKRSRQHNMQAQPEGPSGLVMESGIENYQRNLLSSFKYTKEAQKEGGESDDYECPVCLSGFEEGEDVRNLPRCKHSFHAPCIDMWLYSHLDCPICRTPVSPFCHRHPSESSRPGLLESGGVSL